MCCLSQRLALLESITNTTRKIIINIFQLTNIFSFLSSVEYYSCNFNVTSSTSYALPSVGTLLNETIYQLSVFVGICRGCTDIQPKKFFESTQKKILRNLKNSFSHV